MKILLYLGLALSIFAFIILLGLLIGCLSGDDKADEITMDVKLITNRTEPSKIIYLCVGNPFVYEAYDLMIAMLRDNGYEVIILKYIDTPDQYLQNI